MLLTAKIAYEYPDYIFKCLDCNTVFKLILHDWHQIYATRENKNEIRRYISLNEIELFEILYSHCQSQFFIKKENISILQTLKNISNAKILEKYLDSICAFEVMTPNISLAPFDAEIKKEKITLKRLMPYIYEFRFGGRNTLQLFICENALNFGLEFKERPGSIAGGYLVYKECAIDIKEEYLAEQEDIKQLQKKLLTNIQHIYLTNKNLKAVENYVHSF